MKHRLNQGVRIFIVVTCLCGPGLPFGCRHMAPYTGTATVPGMTGAADCSSRAAERMRALARARGAAVTPRCYQRWATARLSWPHVAARVLDVVVGGDYARLYSPVE